ncbi:MAG: hypothetical protein K5770_11820 [Lachnospiraceae bacterium]|nr:hypothetical protein [Lachnospiraceae bacterium]
MVAFINMFLSYLLLCVIFMAIIIVAVFCGKKLRDNKNMKIAAEQENSAKLPEQSVSGEVK